MSWLVSFCTLQPLRQITTPRPKLIRQFAQHPPSCRQPLQQPPIVVSQTTRAPLVGPLWPERGAGSARPAACLLPRVRLLASAATVTSVLWQRRPPGFRSHGEILFADGQILRGLRGLRWIEPLLLADTQASLEFRQIQWVRWPTRPHCFCGHCDAARSLHACSCAELCSARRLPRTKYQKWLLT